MATMLPPRRPASVTENQFSFSNPADEKPDEPNSTIGMMEYDTWAEKIKGKYNRFGRPEDVKYGAWTRRAATRNDCDEEAEFRWLAKPEDDKSCTPSPELWRGRRTDAVRSAECSPVRRYGNHEARQISNNPRALTIAKYRQEMLDLARDMPENGYELSLRDIVEAPRMTKPKPKEETENMLEEKKKKKEKKNKVTRTISRSESFDTGGPLLKMFSPRMPVVFGGRKQSFGNSSPRSKVSPARPLLVDVEKGGAKKRTEGEWWSKEFGEMVSSTSSSSSSGSSGSSGSRNSRILSSCYPFLGHKGKSMGTEE